MNGPLSPGRAFPDVTAEQAGTTVTIDLDALAANWRLLAERAAPAECSAVVKANAYGIGIEAAAFALTRAGCRTFFVAHVFEGERLRAVAPDVTIYVLNGLLPQTAPLYIANRLRPVLASLPELEDWHRATMQMRAPCALQLDSGMNRLGIGAGEIARAHELSQRLDLTLVLTHFVWSGRAEHADKAAAQVAAFEKLRAPWRKVPASIANSSGIFLGQKPFYDVVRPGYAMFGGNPTPGAPNPMRPVVAMEAKVLQLRVLEAGEHVGYDSRWTAPNARRIATISAGYADGIPCSVIGTNDAAPRGLAAVMGTLCPIVGRVSMDLIAVDVTDAPAVERGDIVELLGPSISIDDLATRAGTIGYEVLAHLGRRSHRRYIGL